MGEATECQSITFCRVCVCVCVCVCMCVCVCVCVCVWSNHLLRMRALTMGASIRGLVPTSSSVSAISMLAIPVGNK